jgi:hypothetical protein
LQRDYPLYGTNKGKKPKKKYKNIAHGGYFYPKLYSLAANVLALLEINQLKYFPRLPTSQKNMSNTIHIIGKVIAHQQFSCIHGDVHSIGVDGGLMDLIDSIPMKDKFWIWQNYFLSADHINLYSVYQNDLKAVGVIRVIVSIVVGIFVGVIGVYHKYTRID